MQAVKEHAKTVWGHLPAPVQCVLRSAVIGAGIGFITGGAAAAMKEVGLQQPNQAPAQASGGSWAGKERYRHHHRHKPWNGR